MKNNREVRNVRVIAENNGDRPGFNIYLDFSGQREYLMFHRHNGLLYGALKDGAALEDLRRWRPGKACWNSSVRTRNTRLYNGIRYVLAVTEAYLSEREEAA